MNLNKVLVAGFLTRDIEMRNTQSGVDDPRTSQSNPDHLPPALGCHGKSLAAGRPERVEDSIPSFIRAARDDLLPRELGTPLSEPHLDLGSTKIEADEECFRIFRRCPSIQTSPFDG